VTGTLVKKAIGVYSVTVSVTDGVETSQVTFVWTITAAS
jgi:hypothetical protein